MVYSIRKIRASERERLLTLYSHLYPTDLQETSEEILEEAWKSILSDPKMFCFVADYKDELIGTCTLIIVPNLNRDARPYAFIENVVVDSKFRNNGIGKDLLNTAIHTAWEYKCYKVMILSSSHNVLAHRFFEKIGFSQKSKIGFEMRVPVEKV
jgi:GNAT superfamily N-acetyltransferase